MVQDWTRDTLTRHQSFPQPRGPHGPDLSDQRRFYEAPETFRHQPPMVRPLRSASLRVLGSNINSSVTGHRHGAAIALWHLGQAILRSSTHG
jgi:hypothetical protein